MFQEEPPAKKFKNNLEKNIYSVECVWLKIFMFLSCNFKTFVQFAYVHKAWNLNCFASLLQKCQIPGEQFLKMPKFWQQQEANISFFHMSNAADVVSKCIKMKSLRIMDAFRLDLTSLICCERLELQLCHYVRLPPNINTFVGTYRADESDIRSHPMLFLQKLVINTSYNDDDDDDDYYDEAQLEKDMESLQYLPNLTNLEFQCEGEINVSSLSFCRKLTTLKIETYCFGLEHCLQIEKLHCDLKYVLIHDIIKLKNLHVLTIENWKTRQSLLKLNALPQLKHIFVKVKKHNLALQSQLVMCPITEV